MKFKDAVSYRIFWANRILTLLDLEMKDSRKVKLPFSKKVKLWSKGFRSNRYYLYGFDSNYLSDYLSDYERYFKARKINGTYSNVLSNKLYFPIYFQNFKEYIPENYSWIIKGRVISQTPKIKNGGHAIMEFIKAKGAAILKPIAGSAGKGICVVKVKDGKIFFNGESLTDEAFLSELSRTDQYIIAEFIQQADFARAIYPRTPNSLRLVTMWNELKDEPFIAVAAHRFGCDRSGPVDNFSRGGISSQINLKTGQLGKVAYYESSRGVIRCERHPDTNAQITGVTLPNWEFLKKKILEIAKSSPTTPYIGWDIIITNDSFKIVEGNNFPNMDVVQIHEGLLKNPQIKKFYQGKGIIK